jgi:hypothetical protein
VVFLELIKNFGRSISIVKTTNRRVTASKDYEKGTLANDGKAKIGPNDELVGYAWQGLPFRAIDSKDPQAGLKFFHNYDHKFDGDDEYQTWTYYLTDDKGNVRTLRGNALRLYYAGRTCVEPKPDFIPGNPEKVWRKQLVQFEEPFSSKGLCQLSAKYADPTKSDDVWMWIPGLRRSIRVGSGDRCDCLGGFVGNLDDNYGWDGMTQNSKWKLLQVKEHLVPTLTPPDTPFPHIKGAHLKHQTLERRTVWLIENISKDPGYCYSKRIFYVDPESWNMHFADAYDKTGKLWKTTYIEPSLYSNPENTGGGGMVRYNATSQVDYKIWEGGPALLPGNIYNSGSKKVSSGLFTLEYLRKQGR